MGEQNTSSTRKPIKKQIRKMVLAIALLSMLIVSSVAVFFMLRIRSHSEASLVESMKVSINNIVDDKVAIAELQLAKYVDYINRSARKLSIYFEDPNRFKLVMVEKPDAANAGKYAMQRTLANPSVSVEKWVHDISLLGNIDYYWEPMMERDGDTITSVYIASKDGYMLSYDKNSDTAVAEDGGESYFDYFERPWYTEAKKMGRPIFTDCSQDYYGRGLTITCAAPYYNGKEFAGVVAMDILVTDLQKNIINVDLGEGSYAFLVNQNGDIMASPYVDLKQTEFENIQSDDSIYHNVARELVSDQKGICKVNDDYYCAHAPIAAANWYLCINVPVKLIMAPVAQINEEIKGMMSIYFIIFLLLIAMVVLIVNAFSKKITKPLLQLEQEVELISAGDIDRQATVIGNDEISDLAIAFNKMTTSLKEYIAEIKSVTAEKERIGAELNVATQIQKSMLPSTFPAFPEVKCFDIFATMDPAKEVGGDFYDFFRIDEKHIAVVVADVSGKGVPAALFMVIGKTLIKDHTTLGNNLEEVFKEVNNMLCEANSEGLFITAFEGVIDIDTGRMVYVNAGHEMPFIYRNGEEFTALQMKPGFVLAGMENMKYKGAEIYLKPGDKFFQYTDGVTEATNANNELYGMDRLKSALDNNANKNVSELLPAVKADIDRFVGEAPQFDDITMLGFEWNPDK